METKKPTVTDTPKSGDSRNGNNPKKPGNDPDQTPEKEVENPPKSTPGKQQQEPSQQPKQKAGFKYNNAND